MDSFPSTQHQGGRVHSLETTVGIFRNKRLPRMSISMKRPIWLF